MKPQCAAALIAAFVALSACEYFKPINRITAGAELSPALRQCLPFYLPFDDDLSGSINCVASRAVALPWTTAAFRGEGLRCEGEPQPGFACSAQLVWEYGLAGREWQGEYTYALSLHGDASALTVVLSKSFRFNDQGTTDRNIPREPISATRTLRRSLAG